MSEWFPIDRKIWIGPRMAAERSGIPERTIRFWAETGRINSIQPGGNGTKLLIHFPKLIERLSPKNISPEFTRCTTRL